MGHPSPQGGVAFIDAARDAALLTCSLASLLSHAQLIIKFEDLDSLKGYMSDHHESIMQELEPQPWPEP